MYESFVKSIRRFDKETIAEAFLAYADYALEGKLPDSENPVVLLAIENLMPVIDNANNRYKNCVENGKKGAKYGKLGGRPKKNNSEKPQEKPQEGDSELTDEKTPTKPQEIPQEKPLYVDEDVDVYEDEDGLNTNIQEYNIINNKNILENKDIEEDIDIKEEKDIEQTVSNPSDSSFNNSSTMSIEEIIEDYTTKGGRFTVTEDIDSFIIKNSKSLSDINVNYKKMFKNDFEQLFQYVSNNN